MLPSRGRLEMFYSDGCYEVSSQEIIRMNRPAESLRETLLSATVRC